MCNFYNLQGIQCIQDNSKCTLTREFARIALLKVWNWEGSSRIGDSWFMSFIYNLQSVALWKTHILFLPLQWWDCNERSTLNSNLCSKFTTRPTLSRTVCKCFNISGVHTGKREQLLLPNQGRFQADSRVLLSGIDLGNWPKLFYELRVHSGFLLAKVYAAR